MAPKEAMIPHNLHMVSRHLLARHSPKGQGNGGPTPSTACSALEDGVWEGAGLGGQTALLPGDYKFTKP